MDERQRRIRVTRGRVRRDLIRAESGRRRAPTAGLGGGAGVRRRGSVGRVGLGDEAPRTRQEGKERARGVCWNCMSPARRLGMRMTAWRRGSSGLFLALEAGTWPAAGRHGGAGEREASRGGALGRCSPGRRWRGGEEVLGPCSAGSSSPWRCELCGGAGRGTRERARGREMAGLGFRRGLGGLVEANGWACGMCRPGWSGPRGRRVQATSLSLSLIPHFSFIYQKQ